jgi:hypothetical protein
LSGVPTFYRNFIQRREREREEEGASKRKGEREREREREEEGTSKRKGERERERDKIVYFMC